MVVTWDSLTGVASTTVASATTTNIAGAATQNIIISGSTDITDFGTVAAGTLRLVKSSGTAKLKYDATKMILPGGADITMAINDTFVAQSLGSGNWIVVAYKKQTGKPVAALLSTDITDFNTAVNALIASALTTAYASAAFDAAVTAALGGHDTLGSVTHAMVATDPTTSTIGTTANNGQQAIALQTMARVSAASSPVGLGSVTISIGWAGNETALQFNFDDATFDAVNEEYVWRYPLTATAVPSIPPNTAVLITTSGLTSGTQTLKVSMDIKYDA